MIPTWTTDIPVEDSPVGVRGWLRLVRRGLPVAVVTLAGLVLLLLLRLAERPIYGARRPWTSRVVRLACRVNLGLIGIGLSVHGRPLPEAGAEVANHASWLDIFALNAVSRVQFVAKAEVAGWAGIGAMARAAGTVFIRRERRDAAAQAALFGEKLAAGQRLLFFPEGTSTDTLRVLPFKPTLFEAFLRRGGAEATIQPVTVIWTAPAGADPRFYGWWGEMDFASHVVRVLAAPRQGRVALVYHPALKVADYPDRKALAAACEAAVRSAFPAQ
jgi:1-acyl-sn-glycerol-3-phosphate acyltransferase